MILEPDVEAQLASIFQPRTPAEGRLAEDWKSKFGDESRWKSTKAREVYQKLATVAERTQRFNNLFSDNEQQLGQFKAALAYSDTITASEYLQYRVTLESNYSSLKRSVQEAIKNFPQLSLSERHSKVAKYVKEQLKLMEPDFSHHQAMLKAARKEVKDTIEYLQKSAPDLNKPLPQRGLEVWPSRLHPPSTGTIDSFADLYFRGPPSVAPSSSIDSPATPQRRADSPDRLQEYPAQQSSHIKSRGQGRN